MFDKGTMQIAKIIKATPDKVGDYYDFPMKLYADIVLEASKYGISQYALEQSLNRLPTQGLAMVFRSPNGAIIGIQPTDMFRNIFLN